MATTHNYHYYIKKTRKNEHVLRILGYPLISKRGTLNYSASDFVMCIPISHKSIPPNHQWQVCHGRSCTTGLYVTTWAQSHSDALKAIKKWHTRKNIILVPNATIWCCNSDFDPGIYAQHTYASKYIQSLHFGCNCSMCSFFTEERLKVEQNVVRTLKQGGQYIYLLIWIVGGQREIFK